MALLPYTTIHPEGGAMAVEIILREDVPNLGKIGDVVRVRPGYARNYLLPRGLAVEASRGNLRQLEHQKRMIAAKAERERKAAEAAAARLEGLTLRVRARARRRSPADRARGADQAARHLPDRGPRRPRRAGDRAARGRGSRGVRRGRGGCSTAAHSRRAKPSCWRRTRCAVATPAGGATRRRSTPSAWRSSATATGSSIRRRSGVSSTRPRSS